MLVNGAVVDTITTDQDTDGTSWFSGTFTDFVVEDVALNTGDTVTLEITSRSGSELGVVDSVSFTTGRRHDDDRKLQHCNRDHQCAG